MLKAIHLFLLTLIPTILLCQKFEFGFKPGFNISNIRSNNKELVPNIKGGCDLFLKQNINKYLFVRYELGYSCQGFSFSFYSYINSNPNATTQIISRYLQEDYYTLNYIKMPASIAVKPFKNNFSANIGLYANYLLNARLETNENLIHRFRDISYLLNDMDYGIVFGIGNEFNNGINYGVQMYLGYRRVFKEYYQYTYNINLQLSMGYTFHKKKEEVIPPLNT